MAEIPTLVKPVGAVTQAVEETIEKGVAKTIKTTAAVVEKVTHPLGRAPKPEAPPHQPQAPG